MFLRALCAILLVGFAGSLTAKPSSNASVPAKFRGLWVVDETTCNIEGMGNDGDIYITANQVSFHAEPYRVIAIRKQGSRYKVTYSPPEQQYMVPPAEFYLSADGKTLSDLWHRCPKSKQK